MINGKEYVDEEFGHHYIPHKVYKIDMNSANSVYKGWEETLTQSSGAASFEADV